MRWRMPSWLALMGILALLTWPMPACETTPGTFDDDDRVGLESLVADVAPLIDWSRARRT